MRRIWLLAWLFGSLLILSTACGMREAPVSYTFMEDDYRVVLDPLAYDLGSSAWSNVGEIDPDALATYYIVLDAMGEIDIPRDGPVDAEYGNPLMPRDELESCVRRYFDVPAEQIRRSHYYDPEQQAYWTGGIGSVVDIDFVRAEIGDADITIHYRADIASQEPLRWKGFVLIRPTGDGSFQYVAHERTESEPYERSPLN